MMVYCFGEILWDVLPQGTLPGGAPMNVCINLRKLGADSAMISAVGNDVEGESLLLYLESNGVQTDFVEQTAYPTGKVLVNLDNPSQAVYDIVFPAAYDFIRAEQLKQNQILGSDILVFGSLALRNEVSRTTLLTLAQKPLLKVFDVNFRAPYYDRPGIEALMPIADWLKINDEELQEVQQWLGLEGAEEQVLESLCQRFDLKLICVTKGAGGASLYHEEGFFHHPGFSVVVKDTIGAGDAFLSGLIYSQLQGLSPQKMLANACALGAFVAGSEGANPPFAKEDIPGFSL